MSSRALLALLAGFAPTSLAAQNECRPPASSNEAKTFAILSVPLAFTGARAPAPAARGWGVGLEVATLPGVDRATATPTYCRPGKGPENTNPLSVVPRLRVATVMHGTVLEAGWTPPVPLKGVTANLVSLAIARPFTLSASLTLGLRLHTVVGTVNAPITCDDDRIADPLSECFGGTRSDDRWTPGVSGVEAVLGAGGSIRSHAGVGYSRLRPRFQVNFTDAHGDTDRRRIEVNLDRLAIFGGISTAVAGVRLTGEAYATVGDAVSLRTVVRYP